MLKLTPTTNYGKYKCGTYDIKNAEFKLVKILKGSTEQYQNKIHIQSYKHFSKPQQSCPVPIHVPQPFVKGNYYKLHFILRESGQLSCCNCTERNSLSKSERKKYELKSTNEKIGDDNDT